MQSVYSKIHDDADCSILKQSTGLLCYNQLYHVHLDQDISFYERGPLCVCLQVQAAVRAVVADAPHLEDHCKESHSFTNSFTNRHKSGQTPRPSLSCHHAPFVFLCETVLFFISSRVHVLCGTSEISTTRTKPGGKVQEKTK